MTFEETMISGIRQGEQDLAHYGVLGMKWGVRKNPNRAATKAIKKLRKYETSSERRKAQANDIRVASAKHQLRANRLLEKSARTRSTSKARKLDEKARKANASYLKENLKAAKFDRASERQIAKGKKWAKKMNQYLSQTSYSDLSKEDIAYARKWLVTAFDKEG